MQRFFHYPTILFVLTLFAPVADDEESTYVISVHDLIYPGAEGDGLKASAFLIGYVKATAPTSCRRLAGTPCRTHVDGIDRQLWHRA